MILAFDIDGTILTPDVKMNVYQKINPAFTLEHYTEYPVWKSLENHNMIPANFNRKDFSNRYRETVLATGHFYEDFINFYNYLKANNHTIYFVTARKPQYAKYTKRQFAANGIPYENVIHLGSTHKADTLVAIGADIIFEDNISVVAEVLNKTNVVCCLMERSYTKDCHIEHERFIKAKTFDVNILESKSLLTISI